jgi:hypothetical protein
MGAVADFTRSFAAVLLLSWGAGVIRHLRLCGVFSRDRS